MNVNSAQQIKDFLFPHVTKSNTNNTLSCFERLPLEILHDILWKADSLGRNNFSLVNQSLCETSRAFLEKIYSLFRMQLYKVPNKPQPIEIFIHR